MPIITDRRADSKEKIEENSSSLPGSTVRNVCKTPVSYFLRLLEFCNYTQLKVFGTVLVATVGRTPPQTWSPILDETFDKATGVSSEFWKEALVTLTRQLNLIRERYNRETGQHEYALSDKLEAEIRARTVKGRCGLCQSYGDFQTEFVPVPHAVFRLLGACIDHASFVCLMVIIRYSLKWNKERGVWGEPVQLDIEEFMRMTGLERRMVSNALALLCDAAKWGLVERVDRKGRPSTYRAIPERFGKLERRDTRTVTPAAGKRERHTTEQGLHEKPPKSTETHANESEAPDDRYYGFCRACGHFAPIEDAPEAARAAEPPPKRAGPSRENTAQPKKSKWAGTKEKIWRLFANQ